MGFTKVAGCTLAAVLTAGPVFAAQLSGDARASIPKDIQQIVVVDYRAMQNSSAAMNLKDKIMPPELKKLESALRQSGMKVDADTEVLAFAAFHSGAADATRTVGIAQGQFQTAAILANFTKQKVKGTPMRNNLVYPMGASGMSVVFLNQTTMVFGDKPSIKASLEAHDGINESFLANSDMMNEMAAVDTKAIWSLLDQKGTQTMMKSVLGDASQLTDYDSVKNRMKSSRYTMEFKNGVDFNMAVVMSDTMTAATAATLMKGMVLMKKTTSGSTGSSMMEKQALDMTSIGSNSGTLTVDYASTDSQFSTLLSSPLFQQVVH
ncbi:hypothetical protein [Terriglobus saanensis]|uniref:Uncharacterized protein n=1 Tax=Terriglobus saanensis (strain ATCC BAA-1853 / DSM 23119 / SP1PR4) TaxID=401053 RepID=E8V1Q8_TERSS|nr:hypothetical protein [Terriglobus saanensis]ADV82339.1 hypothetical protein AciPR4_1517 [Terriglobus saanensis SP1PR4]